MAQDRRNFLALSGATAGLVLSGCSRHGTSDFEAFAHEEHKPISASSNFAELVRAATLAPNGHNTQPWRFAELPKGAIITPDFARRTPIVDPDDHHLFISLGCAAENFLLAASAQGRPGALRFDGEQGGRIEIELGSGNLGVDTLAAAIPWRQSTRSDYNGRPVATSQLKLLEEAALIEGVSLKLITDRAKLSDVLGFLSRGNDNQMEDPRFV
ncbi:MAG: Tat pathway signal protein, partial [Sphingomicrobium sp.]